MTSLRNTRIVLLNDNDGVRDLVEQVLVAAGCEVKATGREEVALRWLLEGPCDVFIEDLLRPDGAGGYAVLEWMLYQETLRSVKRVVLSGYVFTPDLGRELHALGVHEYQSIPCSARNLLDCVRRAVESRGQRGT